MKTQGIIRAPSRARHKLGGLGAISAALFWLVPVTGASSALVAGATIASAAQITTYSATQTIPIPPASNYAGAGGGDGWAVALSNTQVFNVFHHNSVTTVSCHNQSDASECYPARTVTDANGNNFATSGHPGMYLNPSTGKLYTYVTRGSDSTAGVVCIDTTIAATTPNPFCGYAPLTAANDGPLTGSLISGLSNPMQVGTKWYAYNFVNGSAAEGGAGGQNTLLCFDLTTFASCGPPIAVNIGAGNVLVNNFPTPATAAIGTQIIIPIITGVSLNQLLACYDVSTGANCAGSWPAAAPFNYPGINGSPYPLLDASGKLTGLCLPTGTDQCLTLTGAATPTPSGMTAAIGSSVSWNGPALVLGPRVYVPEWSNVVDCFDASTGASCTNFPKLFNNLGLLYTVNPDPQRPTCIWVNADNGSAQIQNFDAYTAGACGQGAVRVLASQFVVNLPLCLPAAYTSLQVLQPLPGTYTSGMVEFDDGDGNPIPGASNRPLDATGTVDLTGLSLNTATGLPQFLVTLTGQTGNPAAVVVKLTWTGAYDLTCIGPNTTTAQTPTTVTTSLSGGGQSGAHITVPAGTQVTDNGTLTGSHVASAGGTVTYTVYSDNACSTVVQAGNAEAVTTPGTLPASAPVTLSVAGTFYWLASYSGDAANFPSVTKCGDETVIVTAVASSPTIDGSIATAQHKNSATALVTTNSSGDLLVAFVRGDGPSYDGNTMLVSGAGLTWTRVAMENRALGDTEVWVATASGILTATPITASLDKYPSTYGLRLNAVITVIPFANASGIGAHETFFSPMGAPSGTLTTTQAGSWVFAAGNDWLSSIDRTAAPDQTIEQQSTDRVGDTYWVQSTSAPTPGSGTAVTINDIAPADDPYNLVLVEVL
jgi:hypothetical protein